MKMNNHIYKPAMPHLMRNLCIAAALCTAVACTRFDAVDKVFDNSIYLDVSATDQTQLATLGNKVGTASKELSVTLAYPEDKDIPGIRLQPQARHRLHDAPVPIP